MKSFDGRVSFVVTQSYRPLGLSFEAHIMAHNIAQLTFDLSIKQLKFDDMVEVTSIILPSTNE